MRGGVIFTPHQIWRWASGTYGEAICLHCILHAHTKKG